MNDIAVVADRAQRWAIDRWSNDPWLFACQQLRTFDEQDQVARKAWPADLLYVKMLFDEIEANRFIAVEKSRQMFATWTVGGYLLHQLLFRPGTRWGVVSTKQDTSQAALDRIWHLWNGCDEWLKQRIVCVAKDGWLTVEHKDGTESWAQAVSTTAASGRSFTFSGIWIDETAWQEGVEQVYTANLPAVQNKGRMILTSSPQAGTFFCNVIDDTMAGHDV